MGLQFKDLVVKKEISIQDLKGKVLAVGAPEITEKGIKRTSPCKIKDIVFYKKWGGNEVKIGNIEYLFVKFEDIMAVEA